MKTISIVLIFVIAMLAIASMYGVVSGGFSSAGDALFGSEDSDTNFSDSVLNPEGNEYTDYRYDRAQVIYSG